MHSNDPNDLRRFISNHNCQPVLTIQNISHVHGYQCVRRFQCMLHKPTNVDSNTTKTRLVVNCYLVLYISSRYRHVFVSFHSVPNKCSNYVDQRAAAATFVCITTVRPSGQIHFDNPDYFHPVFMNADLICRGNPDIVNEWVYWLQEYPVQPDWCF